MTKNSEKRVPALRFKGFTNDWEQRKLGCLMNITSVKRIHQSDWRKKGIPFYRARDITALSKNLNIEEPIFISRDLYEEYSKISGKVQINDLLVTGVGTIGVPLLVQTVPLYFKDGNIIWFQNSNKLIGLFFLYLFKTNTVQKYIHTTTGVGTVPTYTIQSGKNTPVYITSKKEQKDIGTIFQLIDNLISLQQRKLDILIKLNRNIIINLFKEIRVNHHAIELKHTASNWKSARLKELGICQSGFGFPIKEQNGSKGIPFFKVSDFNTFGNEIYLQYANNYVTNHQIRKNKWKIFDQVPAIVFAKVGATIFLNRKRMINEPFLIDNNLMAFELNRQKLDYKFAKILFDNMYLPKFAQVGALPSYNASDINAIKVKIPDMDSQKKIANIIMKNNNEIILQKQILQKGKELKQFLLQNIFI
ncbi:restriction endonuclease subunit S [Lactobacillus amylovorus]|uniref:restriction endonuclease subunit S n=1 Tax=Lactobacillus amylovorus TaxID=1604 RepID=UPI0021C8E956|nr:restriction endonuclease subunit S [Lactobacillus amylovorus]UXN12722.1 restriction endonuclease subunit S [Lactobacillus amylovorus]